MVPMAAPDGRMVWVLIVGLNPGGYAPGSGTQYFVGHFDGSRFINANPPQTELWLDYGRDYYAAQTVFDRDAGHGFAPVVMAWANNWLYAKQAPTKAFRGVMSLPRQLFVVETAQGLRVGMRHPDTVGDFLTMQAGSNLLEYEANLAVGEELAIELFGESQPQFVVRREAADRGRIRSLRCEMAGLNGFEHDYSVAVDWPANEPLRLNAVVDRGLVELSTDDGLIWITNVFYPSNPSR